MKKTALHPEVFLIENFLNSEECNSYLNLYKKQPFEEAKISIHGQQL